MTAETNLYFAFERIEYKRDMRTMHRYKELAEEPGPGHALEAAGTREGDRFWRQTRRGRAASPVFYEGDGPRAACGRRVKVTLPTLFVLEDPDACPDCADLVRDGKARGRFGQSQDRRYPCDEVLQLEHDGAMRGFQCGLQEHHQGEHVDRSSGATWKAGAEDFTPPPDGYV